MSLPDVDKASGRVGALIKHQADPQAISDAYMVLFATRCAKQIRNTLGESPQPLSRELLDALHELIDGYGQPAQAGAA